MVDELRAHGTLESHDTRLTHRPIFIGAAHCAACSQGLHSDSSGHDFLTMNIQ